MVSSYIMLIVSSHVSCFILNAASSSPSSLKISYHQLYRYSCINSRNNQVSSLIFQSVLTCLCWLMIMVSKYKWKSELYPEIFSHEETMHTCKYSQYADKVKESQFSIQLWIRCDDVPCTDYMILQCAHIYTLHSLTVQIKLDTMEEKGKNSLSHLFVLYAKGPFVSCIWWWWWCNSLFPGMSLILKPPSISAPSINFICKYLEIRKMAIYVFHRAFHFRHYQHPISFVDLDFFVYLLFYVDGRWETREILTDFFFHLRSFNNVFHFIWERWTRWDY